MGVYELVLSNSCEESRRLRDYLSVLAEREGFSGYFLSELQLVVQEAFVNAVEHGNKGQVDARVVLRFEILDAKESRELVVEIADSGCGLSLHELPDPTHPSALGRSSGRGIFFMRSFAEIIGQECADGGSVLKLRLKPF